MRIKRVEFEMSGDEYCELLKETKILGNDKNYEGTVIWKFTKMISGMTNDTFGDD